MGRTGIVLPKEEWLRFSIDTRKLNSMTVKDMYPLPRRDEYIDTRSEVQYLTTLEAYAGYGQMNMHKQDHHKTAFVCHAGAF